MSSDGRGTLLAVNGPDVLRVLLLPLVLTVVPLLVPGAERRRAVTWFSAAALVVFVVASGFSIGLFYVPSALAMVWAAGQPAEPRAVA